MTRHLEQTSLSRRHFLATGSAAVAGAALGGLMPRSEAAKRAPDKGGTLRFATRLDTVGLDSHRHTQYHNSHPIAAIYTSLTDLN
jgi:peptide/nickel transport system substrate-binding protein